MSAASCLLTEEQLLCSICLDVFTDPVTIPCGHNFCKTCITQHWNVNVQTQCPNCKEVFYTRPELRVNTFISELKKRSTEVEQLSRSEDHLHLLQSFRTLNTAPPTKNWTGVRVSPPSHEGTVVRAVNQLEDMISKQMKKLLTEVELKRVQQSAVDVTLDPDTANPYLMLSYDGKQVKTGDVKKNLPDNPERFDSCTCVLAKQSFTSGRFYYEVQVKGKPKWDLGVARESINRKGTITPTPQDGYWMICLRNKNEYEACDDPSVRLSLKPRPQKVGVFVDYEEGLVSFHDVDAAALIYSFTGCCFTEKLHPFFGPCLNAGSKNSAPLIISPVNHTE